jgi:hypothetical protein
MSQQQLPVKESAAADATLPPPGIAQVILSDLRTTNSLLVIVVLCMAGLMPDQFSTICTP